MLVMADFFAFDDALLHGNANSKEQQRLANGEAKKGEVKSRLKKVKTTTKT